MGPVADVVESVADVVGDAVEFVGDAIGAVLENPLPTIATIALNFAAPGIGSAIGISQTAVQAIGSAAIAAASGGDLISIATAGIMPYIQAPGFQESIFGTSLDKTITPVVSNLVGGNKVLTNIITQSVGKATTGGLIAAITGQDVLETAGRMGLSTAVSIGVSELWNNLRATAPKLTETSKKYEQGYESIKDTLPKMEQARTQQADLTDAAENINALLDQYDEIEVRHDDIRAKYDAAVAANDIPTANEYAAQLNDDIIPKMNDLATQTNTLFNDYQSNLSIFEEFLNANKADFERAAPIVDELNKYQSEYDKMTNEILASDAKAKLTEAIKNQDWDTAYEYQNKLQTFTDAILEIDPNAQVTTNLNPEQKQLIENLKNAETQTEKYALSQQAKADPTFNKIINSPALNYLKGAASNLVQQGIVSSIVGNLVGDEKPQSIPRQPPAGYVRPPLHVDVSTLTPAKKRPPNKADVSTLTPITDPNFKLPTTGTTTPATTPTTPTGALTTPTTQAEIPAQVTTPQFSTDSTTPTGGLEMASTTPTNTTQTNISGLQSTTPLQDSTTTAPPTKVDVSKLTPVTDTNLLKNLGLNIG